MQTQEKSFLLLLENDFPEKKKTHLSANQNVHTILVIFYLVSIIDKS